MLNIRPYEFGGKGQIGRCINVFITLIVCFMVNKHDLLQIGISVVASDIHRKLTMKVVLRISTTRSFLMSFVHAARCPLCKPLIQKLEYGYGPNPSSQNIDD
jgi:hypothetical protein